jgi:hypothetical protein
MRAHLKLKSKLLYKNVVTKYTAPIGLMLSSFSVLISILLGFGGFSIQSFTGYCIIGSVSRSQLFFLILSGIGITLSSIGFTDHMMKKDINYSKAMFLFSLIVSTLFFAISFFGLTSELRSQRFWTETTFREIQDTILFNNLTLITFFAWGMLQILTSVVFLKKKFLGEKKLVKIANVLTLISGFFFIINAIINFPLIKEGLFVLSYEFDLPFLNNVLIILAPILYLLGQIPTAIILTSD